MHFLGKLFHNLYITVDTVHVMSFCNTDMQLPKLKILFTNPIALKIIFLFSQNTFLNSSSLSPLLLSSLRGPSADLSFSFSFLSNAIRFPVNNFLFNCNCLYILLYSMLSPHWRQKNTDFYFSNIWITKNFVLFHDTFSH